MNTRSILLVVAVAILVAVPVAYAFRNQRVGYPRFVFDENDDHTCFDVIDTSPMPIRNRYTREVVERHYLTWDEVQIRNHNNSEPMVVAYHGTIQVGQRVCGLPYSYDVYVPSLRFLMDWKYR